MNPPDAPGGLGSRREARERAVALLYEAESRHVTLSEVLDALAIAPQPYARELCEGVDAHRGELDSLIDRLATGWAIERMPMIDASVLRMAVFELAYRPNVPTSAVISEAVALAADFSTDGSGPFVNGVLRTASQELRPDEELPADDNATVESDEETGTVIDRP